MPFTISDLSHVWILCDVYENDLAFVHARRIRRHPFERLSGTLSSRGVSAISDRFSIRISAPPRSASKWRIPGMMRLGMFVEATFHGHAEPGPRAWSRPPPFCTCTTANGSMCRRARNTFRRVEVRGGKMIPPGQQEILSGIRPGDRVVTNALDLKRIDR